MGDDDRATSGGGNADQARVDRAPRPVVWPRNKPRLRRWEMPPAGLPQLCIGGLSHLWQWIVQSYLNETTEGNQFSWYVVAFASGAAVYLILPQEPSFWALSAALVIGIAVLINRRRAADHMFILTICLMLTAGVWTGALKSIRSAGPRLDHDRTVTVTGWIVDEETALKGATRMTIQVVDMTGRQLPKSAIPASITVTFRANTPGFSVGEGIRFVARLRPLQGPVMPGGYDFQRRAFFDGRGATGYALGRVGKVDLGVPDWPTRAIGAISQLRHTISQRIRAALPGAKGAIAAAIIVGEQRGIPDAENDAIRLSGLPHMITIAGLHMSIVAGCVFLTLRWLLALIPAIALRYPIKQWAAAGALAATTVYLLISGGHVSAERAYLMSALMLLATIFGRPALTMRNLGLSALILLARNPAQVVEPGFLMSFLAVMSLIAAYRAWSNYRINWPRAPDHNAGGALRHMVRSVTSHGLAAMSSSLIATIATASVTADQFFRVPPYGALSNLIVLPAIDMVTMPAAVLACLAMPFGLEIIPLTVMGWTIDFMDTVGFIAADLPGSHGLIGRIHPWANPLEIAGLLWLCLWHRSWRLLGCIPIVSALMLAPFAVRPDVMIGPDAMPVAVRGADGQLKVLGVKENRFTVANWLMADAAPTAPADPRAPLDPHLSDGWICDPLGCVFKIPATTGQPERRIVVVTDARGFDEDCFYADIIVTRLVAPASCTETALVFDRNRLAHTGATTVVIKATGLAAGRASDLVHDDDARVPLVAEIATALAAPSRAWLAGPQLTEVPPQPGAPSATVHPTATPKRASPTSADNDDVSDSTAQEKPLLTDDLLIIPPSPANAPLARPRRPVLTPETLPLDPTDMPDMPDQ